MNSSVRIKWYALGLFFILSGKTNHAQSTSSNLPNVIIILADDMGYGDVSGLNPRAKTYTPNIDLLIRRGLTFSTAHASASVCTPSRYGLLTGRYGFRSDKAAKGISGFHGPVIENSRSTLANVFSKAGYQTACIGKWHLGLEWSTLDGNSMASYDNNTGTSNIDFTKPVKNGPNHHGFDYSFIHPASLDMPPYVFLRNGMATDHKIWLTNQVYPSSQEDTEVSWDKKHTQEGDVYWNKGVWWRKGEIAASFKVENCLSEIKEEGINFIKKQNFINQTKSEDSQQPFFLYLPLTGPHTPWLPEDKYKGKSALGDYGDFVLNIDGIVGEIYQTLVDLDIDEETIIIFTSDNGAYWPEEEIIAQSHDSNWGSRGQKGDIWDGGHRIPLVMHWPNHIAEGQTYDGLISLTDFYATFKELTNQAMEVNEGEDSFSFLSVLFNGLPSNRSSMIHHSSKAMFAIRDRGWKLIDGQGSGGFTESSSEVGGTSAPGQLYWIESDNIESNNYYLEKPTRVAELKTKLTQQIESGRSN